MSAIEKLSACKFAVADIVFSTGAAPDQISQWISRGYVRMSHVPDVGRAREFDLEDGWRIGLTLQFSAMGVKPADVSKFIGSAEFSNGFWRNRDGDNPSYLVVVVGAMFGEFRIEKAVGGAELLQLIHPPYKISAVPSWHVVDITATLETIESVLLSRLEGGMIKGHEATRPVGFWGATPEEALERQREWLESRKSEPEDD